MLAAAQVFGGIGFFLGVTVAPLLARDVSGREALGGVPLAFAVASGAMAAAPLGAWMARAGRGPGLAAGHLIAASGAAIVVLAAGLESFPLLCLGMGGFGLGNTSARTSPRRPSRSPTPSACSPARGRSPWRWSRTRSPRESCWHCCGPTTACSPGRGGGGGRPGGALVEGAQGSALLAAARLDRRRRDGRVERRDGRRDDADAYSPAGRRRVPLGGRARHLAARRGDVSPVAGLGLACRPLRPAAAIAGGGLALLAAGALAAIALGDNTPLTGLALPLLGVGWNLGLVGGSALLTDAIARERRAQSQGAADLVMGLTGMSGNLVAGPLFHAGAFGVLGAGAAAIGAILIGLAARADTRYDYWLDVPQTGAWPSYRHDGQRVRDVDGARGGPPTP